MRWYHWHLIIVTMGTLISLLGRMSDPLSYWIYILIFNNLLFLPVSWLIAYLWRRSRKPKEPQPQ